MDLRCLIFTAAGAPWLMGQWCNQDRFGDFGVRTRFSLLRRNIFRKKKI